MKSWAVIAALVALTVGASAARAQEDKGAFGLGLIIGEPTGLSGKLYLSDNTAVDMALGGAVVTKGIMVHATFLWHPWVLANEGAFVLPAYIGIGGRAFNHDRGRGEDGDFHLGARFAGGILFDFRRVPLDVFVEVALIADFSNADDDDGGFGLDLGGGAGVRYYF